MKYRSVVATVRGGPEVLQIGDVKLVLLPGCFSGRICL